MRKSSRIAVHYCLAVLCALGAGCKTSPKKKAPLAPAAVNSGLPREIAEIQELEDRRSLGEGKLTQWALSAHDPLARGRALLALARLQDPLTAETIAKGLSDPAPLPRYEAAFAAGALGLSWAPLPDSVKVSLSQAALVAEAAEADLAVKLSLLEALGRLATPAALDRLLERLADPNEELRARAALSLGVAAKREAPLNSKAIPALVAMVKKEAPLAGRYGAAYALAHSRQAGARQWLLLCAQDDASEIRALCARGLGEVGTDVDAVTLGKMLDDGDYRVAAEATRALTKLAVRCKGSTCPAIGALSGLSARVERLARGDSAGGGQPLLALAQQGLPPAGRGLLGTLRGAILSSVRAVTDPAIRQDLAKLDCRLAAALDRQAGALAEVLSCGGGLVPLKQQLVMGLRELESSPPKDPARRAEEVASYVHHDESSVKVAALSVLALAPSPLAVERVRSQLSSPDLVVASAAAAAAGKLKDRESIPRIRQLLAKVLHNAEVAPAVAEALADLEAKEAEAELRTWLQSTHSNVRGAAAAALSRLTGQTVYPERVERPLDKVKPPHLPKDAQLHFKTEKGELTVKLYTAEAPLTSLNLYTLAKKGFFKNQVFHRVVPNFVAQGGDPRGDGEGGPGYTIRCELNHKPYARGVMGMALSGKDTGGSQFFLTTSPQPHLDGRYTAFGQVVKGETVVDSLLEGDRILEVRATP